MEEEARARELVAAVAAATKDDALWPRALDLLVAYGIPLGAMRKLSSSVARHRQLTHAELAVLEHLMAGRTPGEIAKSGAISVSTVRTHIARLREKFGVSRTLDVVRLAMTERPDPS